MPRPVKDFEGFVGQSRVVGGVGRLVKGALTRGEPVPHLLLVGPPGCGKTSLVRAIGRAYGTTVRQLPSPRLRVDDLTRTLHEMGFADILLIDEAHLFGPGVTETLNVAVVDNRAPAPDAEDGTRLESIAEFTLLLATNRPGEIAKALRSRLHEIQFADYMERELIEIARRVAEDQMMQMTPQALRQIAENASSPRQIEKLLSALRVWYPTDDSVDQPMVRAFFSDSPFGTDELGLDERQRRYLCLLGAQPDSPMTQMSLTHALGCDYATVAYEVEPVLFRRRFIEAVARGRRITAAGLVAIGGAP